MKKLRESVSFKPVFRDVIFDSVTDCKWAIFFHALGLKWQYRSDLSCAYPKSESVSRYCSHREHLSPKFRVCYPGRAPDEQHYEWFETLDHSSDLDTDKMCDIVSFVQNVTSLILLDGPPEVGMYVRLSTNDLYVVPFWAAIRELSNPPGKRCGWALWSGKCRAWWDDAENFFSPTTYFGSGTEIEDAVARAKDFPYGVQL